MENNERLGRPLKAQRKIFETCGTPKTKFKECNKSEARIVKVTQ